MRDCAVTELAGVEHLRKPYPRAPHRRRPYAGRRRQIFTERLEHLADETVGRPVGETYFALRLADAQQFGGGLVLVRGEHHAEGREHDVELVGLEREFLGVGLHEFDVPAVGRGAGLAALQEIGHVVGRDHVAPAPRGGERGHAIAGGDVEHAFVPPSGRASRRGLRRRSAASSRRWRNCRTTGRRCLVLSAPRSGGALGGSRDRLG